MGVTGLWRLIEPSGKPVPIETLENKVLAVDISIWLHQVVKGYQNAKGAPIANAHLLGLFQRLCKLLYYRIKPVFVFDGGYPDLKKETIARRQDSKAKFNSESERLKREIMLLLGKRTAIGSILGEGPTVSPTKKSPRKPELGRDDMFKLPEIAQDETVESSETDSETDADDSVPVIDLHSVDIESENFKSLPLREKHDLLTELKETRKMNSWGRLHELPKQSDNFSDFQMKRLLKRRKVQECLEETEKEMGGNFLSINELESLLNEEGIETKLDSLPTKRIAYDDKTRFLLINDMNKAKEEAKARERDKQVEKPQEELKNEKVTVTTEEEDELQKAIKMSLECVDENKKESSPDSTFMLDSDYSESETDEDPFVEFNSAKAYIMQNTDFTKETIGDIIKSKHVVRNSKKNQKDKMVTQTYSQPFLSSESEDETSKTDIKSDESAKKFGESEEKNESCNVECKNSVNRCTKNNTDETLSSNIVSESETSEEDFVEVEPLDGNQKSKIIAELNIDYNKVQDEEDIFADVFEKLNHKNVEHTIDSAKNLTKEPDKQEPNHHKITKEITDSEIPTTKVSEIIVINEKSIRLNEQSNDSESVCAARNIGIKQVEETEQTIEMHMLTNDRIETETEESNQHNEIDLIEICKTPEPPKQLLTAQELKQMSKDLEKQSEALEEEKCKLDRMSRNISEEMTRDAKEMLRIFGIPYIVAPTEAEAQCAFLEAAGLTDGTITDDSDIWLFGGKTVYKNFFDQKKHVLQFQAEKIEKAFNLSRDQLILLALLVGSDYTLGVRGVGPVTAMEILASFPPSKKHRLIAETAESLQVKCSALLVGLEEFKRWVRSGRRTDDTSLRNKLKNVNVTEDFPSVRVVQAYLDPRVNKSKETFTWGFPDVTVLRDFAHNKFGWSQSKFDDIMTPVLKRIQDKQNQKSLKDYFKRNIQYADMQLSKRVMAAVNKMADESVSLAPTEAKPKRVGKRKTETKVESELFLDSEKDVVEAGSSKIVDNHQVTKKLDDSKKIAASFDIKVPKLDRYQEVIPQREKDKLNVIHTKLRAIELYRKVKIDKPVKKKRRTAIQPKKDAGLSESDSD